MSERLLHPFQSVHTHILNAPQRAQGFLSKQCLLDNQRVRRLIRSQLPPIEINHLPEVLERNQRVILVSNYPSVESALSSLLLLGTMLLGDKLRLKAIAREEVVTNAPFWLKALGFHHAVLPAIKDEKTGEYTLGNHTVRRMLTHMKTSDAVLWLSATGSTYPNDLSLQLAKPGPGWISFSTQTPILPMALHTETLGTSKKPRRVVSRMTFGDLMAPPIKKEDLNRMTEVDRATLYVNHTQTVIKKINDLLLAS